MPPRRSDAAVAVGLVGSGLPSFHSGSACLFRLNKMNEQQTCTISCLVLLPLVVKGKRRDWMWFVCQRRKLGLPSFGWAVRVSVCVFASSVCLCVSDVGVVTLYPLPSFFTSRLLSLSPSVPSLLSLLSLLFSSLWPVRFDQTCAVARLILPFFSFFPTTAVLSYFHRVFFSSISDLPLFSAVRTCCFPSLFLSVCRSVPV
mmetsp:Transcript_38769/g.76199  ORF Transcript_38769/g.76199 Transcript_38769/m.76199 type:complete len:201 (-) Transcript_38769:1479-2081(-)